MNENDSSTPVRSRDRVLEVVLFIAGALIAGITGLLTIGFLLWLSDRAAGRDEDGKHGISDRLPSRLGGFAVFVSALLVLWGRQFTSSAFAGGVLEHVSIVELAAVLIGLIGLAEDLLQSLRTGTRLFLLFVVASVCIALRPDMEL